MTKTTTLQRAQGCLLGQLSGDALGSLVEFKTPQAIARNYPQGVRTMEDGGTWNTLAGQPTDDSEMALALARQLLGDRRYDVVQVKKAYMAWLASEPFDCGNTVRTSLTTTPSLDSQANGALMRISPLGIAGTHVDPDTLCAWAAEDARLTHPHDICVHASQLFVDAIASAIRENLSSQQLYERLLTRARMNDVPAVLMRCLIQAANEPPADYLHLQGWVLIAFQNAIWQLLHAPNFETAVVDTVMRGGDTDTNAAICGALLGAVHGINAIPEDWVATVLACRAEQSNPRVKRPRPPRYWPTDAMTLAEQLLSLFGNLNE